MNQFIDEPLDVINPGLDNLITALADIILLAHAWNPPPLATGALGLSRWEFASSLPLLTF